MGYCVTYCFIVIWSIYRDVFVQILHRVPFLLHRFHPHSFIYCFIINLNLVDFQNQGKRFILVTGRLSLLRCTSITPEPNLPCGETFRCQRANHCVPYVASSFSFTTPNFSSLLLPACPSSRTAVIFVTLMFTVCDERSGTEIPSVCRR